LRRAWFDSVIKPAEFSDHFPGALLLAGLVLRSGFPVAISSRQATKFVGNYSNGLIVSQARHVTVIENLEDAPFLFDRRIGGLAKIKELGVRRPAEF
jgi:hypothetical protein